MGLDRFIVVVVKMYTGIEPHTGTVFFQAFYPDGDFECHCVELSGVRRVKFEIEFFVYVTVMIFEIQRNFF